MGKKYSVFISSTHDDLKEERQKVIEALLRNDCIPVAMEYFSGSSREPWEVIKLALSEIDYVILISAGKYGSIVPEEEISYTEKEFDYAISLGIPVIACVPSHRNSPYGNNMEKEDELSMKLRAFKKRLGNGRTLISYDSPDDLGSKVKDALRGEFRTTPRPGWTRGHEVSEFHTGEVQPARGLSIAEQQQLPQDAFSIWLREATPALNKQISLPINPQMHITGSGFSSQQLPKTMTLTVREILLLCRHDILQEFTLDQFGAMLDKQAQEIAVKWEQEQERNYMWGWVQMEVERDALEKLLLSLEGRDIVEQLGNSMSRSRYKLTQNARKYMLRNLPELAGY